MFSVFSVLLLLLLSLILSIIIIIIIIIIINCSFQHFVLQGILSGVNVMS